MVDLEFAEEELRRALSGPDREARLRSAWSFGKRSCPDDLAAAWGLGSSHGGRSETEPCAEYRRLFPMALTMARELDALAVLAEEDPDVHVRATACQFLARAARPEDAAIYAVLSRIVANDPIEAVRVSVIANIRQDAPKEVRRAVRRRMRAESDDGGRAALEGVLATTETAGEFLSSIGRKSAGLLQHALMLLRTKGIAVSWQDMGDGIERRSFPVLLEVARLFADRPEEPPLSFWLRCVTYTREVHEQPAEIGMLVVDATICACRASASAPSLTLEELELLHRALTVLADTLPRVAHQSYLELKAASAIPYTVEALEKPVRSAFARLWLAMVRLSPTPESYVLRPAYK